MSTEDNTQPYGDQRPAAVRHATAGAQAWRAVVHAHQVATPDHADFYSLAGHLVDTFAAVESLIGVLSQQIQHYPDRLPIGRRVYDDTRTTDPRVRLDEALASLDALTVHVRGAQARAHRFWSVIGHIGVADAQPWPGVTW